MGRWTVGARVMGRWKQAGLGNGFVMIEGYEFTMVWYGLGGIELCVGGELGRWGRGRGKGVGDDGRL